MVIAGIPLWVCLVTTTAGLFVYFACIPLWLCLLTTMAGLAVYYMWHMSMDLNLFDKMRVPGPGPMPVLGNLGPVLISGHFQTQVALYKAYKDHKVFGIFDTRTPCVVVTDLSIIQDILVKHFDKFPNRQRFVRGESILHHSLPLLQGDHWRRVRDVVHTTLSDPEVLRNMAPRLERCTKAMFDWLVEQIEEEDEVDLRELSVYFNIDSLMDTCFGIESNSFQDPEYDYVKHVKKVSSALWWTRMVHWFAPFLYHPLRFLGYCYCENAVAYFNKLTDTTVSANRAEEEVTFMQLISKEKGLRPIQEGEEDSDSQPEATKQAQVICNSPLSDRDIKGQALSLAVSSYETVPCVMSYTLFMLANNKEWRQKVQEEIDDVLELERCLTFDNIRKLASLDLCIKETMRMFPSPVEMERVCLQEVNIQGFCFPKGMPVYLPVYAVHNDADLWPYPEEFVPERFSKEHDSLHHPFAFLPFGAGPRTCVGKDVALMFIKIGIASILRRLTPSPGYFTVCPPKLSRYSHKASDGLWVKFDHRA